MAKVKWKRTRNGIEFIEKKSLAERFQSISFMQTALGIFALALIVILACLIRAICTNGHMGLLASLGGFLAFALGIAGLFVTCYGHFSVEAESKIPWKIGIYTNGGLCLVLVLIYLFGILFG